MAACSAPDTTPASTKAGSPSRASPTAPSAATDRTAPPWGRVDGAFLVRLTIRVKPRSRQPGVGGTHDGELVVRVRERAAEGRATEAALVALADALGVPRRAVSLVHGATSRT